MYRKTSLAVGEHYHVYSRGVEKRKIFMNTKDYNRFVALLYIMNQDAPFTMGNFLRDKNKSLEDIFTEKREKTLVSVLGYCLMPNHFHLILYENSEGGISKFMGKLLTAYSMYFNTKYHRTGSLFEGRFKATHADGDEHLKYLFSYIHLNPVKIIDSKWRENGINDRARAKTYLEQYRYSSYLDYRGKTREEAAILNKSVFPEYFESQKDFEKFVDEWLSFSEENKTP